MMYLGEFHAEQQLLPRADEHVNRHSEEHRVVRVGKRDPIAVDEVVPAANEALPHCVLEVGLGV